MGQNSADDGLAKHVFGMEEVHGLGEAGWGNAEEEAAAGLGVGEEDLLDLGGLAEICITTGMAQICLGASRDASGSDEIRHFGPDHGKF